MREMTGTELISRRASDFSYHLSNTKLTKSRSNLELNTHNRSEYRNHERHGNVSQKTTDKSNNGSLNTSRKNSRGGHRVSDSFIKTSRSKSKEVSGIAENPDANKAGVSASILPPISGHQISNVHVKNGGLSPRHADSSAPTRLAIRNSASPENMTGKPSETNQSHPGNEGTSRTPPITGHCLVKNGSSANNVSSLVRSAQVTSPESLRFPDTSRLSPINSIDKPKVKFEKKVMKQLVDESVPSSPRAYKISSAEQQNQQHPPPSRDSKGKQRRPSIKSLPKIVNSEEPFSVRRKIEQFRKWHEEHYADALKPSGFQEEAQQAAKDDGKVLGSKTPDGVDFAKILENNINQNRLSTAEGERVDEITIDTNKPDINGNIVDKPKNSPTKEDGKSSKARLRPKSSATWKTWRDVNQSDAYDDVKQYIKDNDLMDEQRAKWIRTWICDVRTAMEESEEIFVDEG